MRRVDLLVEDKTIEILKSMDGTLSSHLRRAVEEYLDKIISQKASASQSKKGGVFA